MAFLFLETRKLIAINPQIAFGRPTLAENDISTEPIVEPIDAGKSVADRAEDYALSENGIVEAALYERAA